MHSPTPYVSVNRSRRDTLNVYIFIGPYQKKSFWFEKSLPAFPETSRHFSTACQQFQNIVGMGGAHADNFHLTKHG